MQIDTTLRDEDYTALGEYLLRRGDELRKRRLKYVAIRAAVMLVLIVGAVLVFGEQRSVMTPIQIAVTFVAIVGVYLWLAGRGGRKSVERRVARILEHERSRPVRQRRYLIVEGGIAYTQDGTEGYAPWEETVDIVLTGEHIFVFPNEQGAYIIPLRDFPSDENGTQFYRLARERWMEHRPG